MDLYVGRVVYPDWYVESIDMWIRTFYLIGMWIRSRIALSVTLLTATWPYLQHS